LVELTIGRERRDGAPNDGIEALVSSLSSLPIGNNQSKRYYSYNG
jgi:hypothetical protein